MNPLGLMAAALLLGLALVPEAAEAVVLQMQATLEIFLFDLDPLAPSLVASGAALVTLTGGEGAPVVGLSIPAGVVATQEFPIPVTDPAAAPIAGLEVSVENEAGAFALAPVFPGGPMHLAGQMPLAGTARICLLAPCESATELLTLDIDVIGGPTATRTATHPGTSMSALNVTLGGAPWTTGPVFAGEFGDVAGSVHGPLSATSSVSLPGGTLSLVTPIFIATSIPGAPALISGYGRIRLAPEPGALLQSIAGIVVLALVGRRRARARREIEETLR